MEAEKKLTGYPSIDKPWLKYYTEEAINAPLPECTIYEYLWENNKDHLEDYALDYYGTKITYGQLFKNIKSAASGLYALGIRKGDIVTVLSVNTPELIYCLFGLNIIGAIPMMEYVTESADEALKNIESSHSEYVIVLDYLLNNFQTIALSENIKKIIVLGIADSMPLIAGLAARAKVKLRICEKSISYKEMISVNGEFVSAPYIKNQTAVIVHSGGTTGTPKGVCLSNENVNYVAWAFIFNNNDFYQKESMFSCIPAFHAFGFVMGLVMPLNKGGQLILTVNYDEKHFVQTILRKKPNHSMSSSTYMSAFIEDKKIQKMDFSHYHVCGLGGTPMTNASETNLESFFASRNSAARPNIGYGMSELASAVCTELNRYYGKKGSVGLPLPKAIIRVIDTETNEELPYNQDGELYISSPGLMLQYHLNEAETKAVLYTDSNGVRWIKSGDLGHIDEDGFVFITGKLKRIYTARAQKDGPIMHIFPDYIANVVAKHPAVNECAIVCIPHPELKSIPVAFVTVNEHENSTEISQKILDYCMTELPQHSIPKHCYVVPSIPKTPIGKVDYRALEKEAENK